MSQPELNPKHLVWYPLFTLVLFLLLYFAIDLPIWALFVALFLIVLYYLTVIIIEIKRK